MAGSPDVETRKVTKRYKIALLKKVEKGFSRPGDKDNTVCITRALEEATREIYLNSQELAEVLNEVRANEQKFGKVRKADRK